MALKTHAVTLTLPKMPPRSAPGSKKNFRRWHCWVEAVRALAEHYHGARPRPRLVRR